jgi:peptidoglycan/xylan/chitin deacetylase (PgdA/CDA1 family)
VRSKPATRETYLEETVRQWLGLLESSGLEVPRLPAALARRFLREEEYERSYRDQWGCWEFGFSESFLDGTLLSPAIDQWAAEERRRLEQITTLVPLWPDGQPFVVCLGHDVDLVSTASTPRQVARSMQNSLERPQHGGAAQRLLRYARPPVRLARAARDGLARSPSAAPTLERCVAVELELGVRGSYFFTVLPERRVSRYDCLYALDDPCVFRSKRQRVADVIVQLAEDGFDVGLHGSYHSALEPGLLTEQKNALERATGIDVTTTRQHFLHWDIHTTPRLQNDAGLAADSTLGFNRSVGFRAGTSLPYYHFDLENSLQLELLQVPLIVQDGPLFSAVALELDVDLAMDLARHVVDVIATAGGIANFSFHPNNVEDERYLALYRSTIEYGLERGAWVTSVDAIQSWWRERARLLAA